MTIKDENSLALLAFNVGSNQFDINRGLAYISMRDQVLRARTLINASVGAKLFEQRAESKYEDGDAPVDYDVTVLGAGVGGISVALAAVENNLKTLVIDKNDHCFSLLRQGTDRLLSTTVYDWPANHFNDHHFPDIPGITCSGMHGTLVLKFPASATRADALAAHLEKQVSAAQSARPDLLRFAYGFDMSHEGAIAPGYGRRLFVRHDNGLPLDKTTQRQIRSRIVVYAFGFGSEKVMMTPGTDSNASFWGYNTLESDLDKLATAAGTGQVDIQGAGDGGLQEALRFTFGPKWQDLSAVASKLETLVAPHFPDWHSRLRDIMLAEDNAARAYMWGYGQESVFEPVDRVHQSLVDELLAKASKQVENWFDMVGRKQDLRITVYDTHAFSGRVYALNRFLFKLLVALTGGHAFQVEVRREMSAMPMVKEGIQIDRSGLAQLYEKAGTASKADYLRRATLRAIPNQYGVAG